MTPEKTIKKMMMLHPSVNDKRLKCLDHLFLVIGNGYKWENGELVGDITLTENETEWREIGIKNMFDMFTDIYVETSFGEKSEYFDVYKGSMKRGLERLKNNIISTLPEQFEKKINNMDMPNNFDLYPLCEYSKIMNIPNDITDEWKECVREFYNFLKESDNEKIVKWREDNKEMFDKILINF